MAEQIQVLVAKLTEHEKRLNELGSGKWIIPTTTGDTGKLEQERQERAQQVVKIMYNTFNEQELDELCFDFKINPEDVPGDTRRERILAFVWHFYRRKTLGVLINWLSGIRPNETWPDAGI